jgi:hypothetical protein
MMAFSRQNDAFTAAAPGSTTCCFAQPWRYEKLANRSASLTTVKTVVGVAPCVKAGLRRQNNAVAVDRYNIASDEDLAAAKERLQGHLVALPLSPKMRPILDEK